MPPTDPEKLRQVTQWWADGLSYAEIGRRLGMTREGARLMVHTARKRLTNLPERQKTYSAMGVARLLRKDGRTILKAIRHLDLGREPEGKNGGWRLTEEEVGHLRNLLQRRCLGCGGPVDSTRRSRCGAAACERKVNRIRHAELCAGSRAPLRVRRSELPERVKALLAGKPVRGPWVRYTDARDASGLTPIQLQWLSQRNIIATRPSDRLHPVTGKPERLYSLGQMRAIRRMLEEETP